MNVLGQDVRDDFAAKLSGRLYAATLTRSIPGSYDPEDPASGTHPQAVSYSCDAIAFAYRAEFVDGEKIKNTSYRVLIMLGSFTDEDDEAADITPQPGDTITIPPPGSSTPATATIEAIETRTNAAITVRVGGFVDG